LVAGCASGEGPSSGAGAVSDVVSEDGAPTVVLITVDSWRADRLGIYGGKAPTSPWLDELGRSALVFDEAIAPAPWTWPSLVSVLTGLSPRSHGAVSTQQGLCAEAVTLPEVFSEQGWRTAFVGINPYLVADNGLRQGFDRWWAEGMGSDQRVVEEGGRLLREAGAVPLFLHLHFVGPQSPYEPSEASMAAIAGGGDSWPRVRTWSQHGELPAWVDTHCVARSDGRPSWALRGMQRAYDAELMDLDRRLGRVEDLLRSTNRWDKAWVVVAGDHGEEFCDHGMVGHGDSTHAENTRVPLVIRPPLATGTRPRRIAEAVSLVDLSPTLATAVLGSPHPSWDGRDLGPLMRGEPGGGSRPVVSETTLLDGAQSLVGPEGRLVLDCCPTGSAAGAGVAAPSLRLYELSDPAQSTDLLAPGEDVVPSREVMSRAARLFEQLDAELERQSARKVCEGEVIGLSEEQRQQLRSQGFVTD
ncbi:MAG: sulfatase, partial [Myxococcota bacterium]|nr:sulfatase [Myxococcota bacterium]